MNSAFQFSFKPQKNKKNISFRRAGVKNVIKKFIKSRIRYWKKVNNYRKLKKQISKLTTFEEVAAVTSVVRPGELDSNWQQSYLDRKMSREIK